MGPVGVLGPRKVHQEGWKRLEKVGKGCHGETVLESGSSCKFEQWESSRLSAAAGEQCSTENKLKAARFLLAMAYFTSKRWIVLPGGPLGPLCPLIPVPGAPRSPLSPGKPTETLKSRTHFQTNENKFSYLAKRRNVQGVYETQLRWLLIKVFAWNCG